MVSTSLSPAPVLAPDVALDSVADAEHMAERHLARTEEVQRVAGVVRWLDDLVRVPGTKFGIGLDAILGFFVPVVGDVVTGLVSLTLLRAAVRRGVPRIVIARMFVNIAVDSLFGMVPVVGDVFDVLWRSNSKNLALLERHQGELEPVARKGDWLVVGAAATLVAATIAAPIFLIAWLLSAVFG
jgi:hypothetical protein